MPRAYAAVTTEAVEGFHSPNEPQTLMAAESGVGRAIYRTAAVVWPHLPLLERDPSVSQRGVLDAEVGVLLVQGGRRRAGLLQRSW